MIKWFYDPHKSENFWVSAPALFGGLQLHQNPQLSSTSLWSDLLLPSNHLLTDAPLLNEVLKMKLSRSCKVSQNIEGNIKRFSVKFP